MFLEDEQYIKGNNNYFLSKNVVQRALTKP